MGPLEFVNTFIGPLKTLFVQAKLGIQLILTNTFLERRTWAIGIHRASYLLKLDFPRSPKLAWVNWAIKWKQLTDLVLCPAPLFPPFHHHHQCNHNPILALSQDLFFVQYFQYTLQLSSTPWCPDFSYCIKVGDFDFLQIPVQWNEKSERQDLVIEKRNTCNNHKLNNVNILFRWMQQM